MVFLWKGILSLYHGSERLLFQVDVSSQQFSYNLNLLLHLKVIYIPS